MRGVSLSPALLVQRELRRSALTKRGRGYRELRCREECREAECTHITKSGRELLFAKSSDAHGQAPKMGHGVEPESSSTLVAQEEPEVPATTARATAMSQLMDTSRNDMLETQARLETAGA